MADNDGGRAVDGGRTVYAFPYMVRWFSPTLLANAAVRAAVSPVFGTFADARAAQANVDGFSAADLQRAVDRHNLSDVDLADADGAVWVDYLADTGDGFDSTYTMASLVAAGSLTVARSGSKDAVELPAGKVLIPGVIESKSNFIEHPEVIAQRIGRYAKLVGRENVIAGSDCGYGTWVGQAAVDPDVVFAKFKAMADRKSTRLNSSHRT